MSSPTTQAPASRTAVVGVERSKERELLSGLLADDPSAWRLFNERYSRLILANIARVTNRFAAKVTDDDVNEVYAIFCLELLANDKAKLRSFAPERGSRLGTWFGLLATHAAYDFLRRRRREPRFDELSDTIPESRTIDPFTACCHRERARIAGDLMSSFSDNDRRFIALYYGEGLEPNAVARRMNISIKTVYTKRYKIQSRLESLLQQRQLAA